MILSDHEFKAIASGSHTSPHELLGMHRMDEGLVVRAFLPLAMGVVVVPVHDSSKPVIPLRRLGESDLFEGLAEGQERQPETLQGDLGPAEVQGQQPETPPGQDGPGPA